jgi:uncharacterized protein (UPF0335 family)
MKRYLALACVWPALLTAQEPAQQGAALKKWHDEQVAIGNANQSARAKRSEETMKAIVDLERREKLMFQAYADVYKNSDTYGFDPDYIKATGLERRKRIELDERSSAHLDSVRRVGDPDAILTVLTLRRDQVNTFAEDSRKLEYYWKDMLTRWQRGLDRAKGDDKPSNPAPVKAAIRAAIDHLERLVRLGRGVIEFESKRAAEMQAESNALGRQIEAGKS